MSVGERDFSPRLLAIQAEPPSPLPRAVLGTLVLLVIGLIVWATVGRLDIVARANGKLISASRMQVVQPLEGGRVERILVREGERVEAGQTLLVMDRQFSQVDTAKLRAERESARYELLRVEAELAETPLVAPADADPASFERTLAAYRANREALQAALEEQRAVIERARQDVAAALAVKDKLTATLPIYRENEAALAKLAKSGNVNKLALLEKRKERIEAERDLAAQSSVIAALEAQIGEAEAKQRSVTANYRRDLLAQRTQLAVAFDKLEQDWHAQQHRNRLMELTAPQAGFVQDLAVHTEGSVVPAGNVLLTLVPAEDPLRAEVYLENQDIGFVREGQKAQVKLAAYEFQRYGLLEAEVEEISADSLTPDERAPDSQAGGYRARLALQQQYLERDGRRFELRPGMSVTAEVNTGTRTVLEYLLSPISKALHEAGTER